MKELVKKYIQLMDLCGPSDQESTIRKVFDGKKPKAWIDLHVKNFSVDQQNINTAHMLANNLGEERFNELLDAGIANGGQLAFAGNDEERKKVMAVCIMAGETYGRDVQELTDREYRKLRT